MADYKAGALSSIVKSPSSKPTGDNETTNLFNKKKEVKKSKENNKKKKKLKPVDAVENTKGPTPKAKENTQTTKENKQKSPKKKKGKKPVDAEEKTKGPILKTNENTPKAKENTLESKENAQTTTENTKKIKKKKKGKKKKTPYGAAVRLDKKQKADATGASDEKKVKGKKQKKAMTTDQEESTEVGQKENAKQLKNSQKAGKKRSIKSDVLNAKAKKAKITKMTTEEDDDEEDDDDDDDDDDSGIDNQAGFSPPAGLVHESLVKITTKTTKTTKASSKKRKMPSSETEDSDDEGKVSKKTKRLRKDRLAKLTNDRTIFIGNLPIETPAKQLEGMFKTFGEIEAVRYRCLPVNNPNLPKKVIAIKKEFHPERHNCVAYIKFKEAESATKSLILNGEAVNGLHIRVDMAGAKAKNTVKTSVFVGNLPFDIEEETVRQHFVDCGQIQNVRLIRDKATCLGKGFGYVNFQDKDAVGFALKLNGSKLKKRDIRVMSCAKNSTQKAAQKTKSSDKKDRGPKEKKMKVKEATDGDDANEWEFSGEKAKKDKKTDKKFKKKKQKVTSSISVQSKVVFHTKEKTNPPKASTEDSTNKSVQGTGGSFVKKDFGNKSFGDRGSFVKKDFGNKSFGDRGSFGKKDFGGKPSGFPSKSFSSGPSASSSLPAWGGKRVVFDD